MKKYKIIVSETAEQDLENIILYLKMICLEILSQINIKFYSNKI